jgi:dihydrofolate reductase
MRKTILYMQSTLNGHGADPGNTMEWATVDAGTWAVTNELTPQCEAVLIGGRLYEEFLDYWPAAETSDAASPDARRLAAWFRQTDKLVLSRTIEAPDERWPRTEIIGDVEALRKRLDAVDGTVFVTGGIGLGSALARAGLLDELLIHVNPRTIAEGRPLLSDELELRLLEARPLESGVVVLHYAVEHEEAR